MIRKTHPTLALLALLLLGAASMAGAGESLDAANQRKLNTFFSNFSEAGVKSFTPATLTDGTLLDFALRHNYLNRLDKLKRSEDGLAVLVTPAQVDETTDKYFGRSIGSHTRGSYPIPMADGDPIAFSQIRALTPYGDAQYLAEGVVYLPGGPDSLDTHGTPASWKRAGVEVSEVASFTAIVEKVRTGGKARWVLREYTLSQSDVH